MSHRSIGKITFTENDKTIESTLVGYDFTYDESFNFASGQDQRFRFTAKLEGYVQSLTEAFATGAELQIKFEGCPKLLDYILDYRYFRIEQISHGFDHDGFYTEVEMRSISVQFGR